MTDIPAIAVSDPPFSLIFDPKSSVQRGMLESLAGGDTYEPGTWEAFKRILRPGDHHVEVGAHVGVFACLAAAILGPTGVVTAFEPDKKNYQSLVRNKVLNGFAQMDVKPKAVGVCRGRVVLHRCADNDGGHALYDPGLQKGNEQSRKHPSKRMVDAVALDDITFPSLRLIKIDVEGAETLVLRGAQQTIRTQRPAIIAEQNTIGQLIMGTNEQELRALIDQHDYRTYAIQDAAPYFIPLLATQTINNEQIIDGQRYLNVYNLLFIPSEWPEF